MCLLYDSEIKAIFEHISGCNATRNRTMLIVGIGMALRASELVGLKVGDMRDKKGKVKKYVTIRGETAKFNKERIIRISDEIQKMIADYIIEYKRENHKSTSSTAPLFASNKGGHLTRQGLFDLIKRIFSRAGIDQSPHCLRKTGATLYYIESDYDLIATQHFLGHANPSTTREYIGLTSEQVVEYAERMSNHLFSAIKHGKLDTEDDMSSFYNLTVNDAIAFLNQKGFEVTLKRRDAQKEKKVIPFPKKRVSR